MQLDFSTIFLNVVSNIPWWVYPIFILALILKSYNPKKRKKFNHNKYEFKETKLTAKEKKIKGDKYEAYICEIFKNDGDTIAPHGKDNGVHDQGIDIIAKKDKEILFVQCKDWNLSNGYKIDHKEIQYIRMNVRDYLESNPLFKNYDWKIIYVTSEDILDKSANYKIIEHDNEIEHKIIAMKQGE